MQVAHGHFIRVRIKLSKADRILPGSIFIHIDSIISMMTAAFPRTRSSYILITGFVLFLFFCLEETGFVLCRHTSRTQGIIFKGKIVEMSEKH